MYGASTLIQWLDDPETSKRFFPAVNDGDFGFRLHQADNAVNKVLCASRRNRAARDAVDLVSIVRRYAPLGPLIWAACAKDDDLNPLRMAESIRKNAFGYADVEIRTVRMDDGESITREELREVLVPALQAATAYCEEVAPEKYTGYLFVNQNEVPVAASAEDIATQLARAIPIKDFRALPIFPTQTETGV